MAQLILGRRLRASLGVGTRKGTRTSKELEVTRIMDHGLPHPPAPGPQLVVASPSQLLLLSRNARYVVVHFSMSQNDFLKLVERVGSSVEHLEFCAVDKRGAECDGTAPCADFDAPEVSFPKLRVLRIHGQCFNAVHLTRKETPALEVLTWEHDMGRPLAYFRMDLPKLRTVRMAFLELADARSWGASLGNSPELQHFVAYKLWGLPTYDHCRPHRLELPSCTHFVLIRSDDLDHMSLSAPRLRLLNLRACYNAQTVGLDASPRIASKFRLVAVNASRCLPTTAVTQHPRCGRIIADDDDSGMGNTEQEERDRHEMWRALPTGSIKHPPTKSYVHTVLVKDMFGFTTGKTDANVKKIDFKAKVRIEMDHTKVYGRGQHPESAAAAAATPDSGWRLWSMDRSSKTISQRMKTIGMGMSGDNAVDDGDDDMEIDNGPGLAQPKAKVKAKARTKATAKQRAKAKAKSGQMLQVAKTCLKKR